MNMSTDNIVTIITCLISAFVGYIACHLTISKPHNIEILKKQLYKVYLPLFQKIEPNLYSIISMETAKEYIDFFNNLKSKYYELIDSELCGLFFDFELSYKVNYLDQEKFSYICSKLDFLFESTRKKLHMPTRNIFYKIHTKQYPRYLTQNLLNMMAFLAKLIIFIGFIIIFNFTILYVTNTLESSLNQFIQSIKQ